MKIDGSKEDPELEIQRRELEDQVGGLDRKLSSMNPDEKNTESEVRVCNYLYTHIPDCISVAR